MSPVPDDGAVQQFAAQCPDPSFREGVGDRCADRGLENLDAFGSEHFIEAGGELAATIAYQCSGVGQLFAMA